MKKKKVKEPELFDTESSVSSRTSDTGKTQPVVEALETTVKKESLKELSIRLRDQAIKEKLNPLNPQ